MHSIGQTLLRLGMVNVKSDLYELHCYAEADGVKMVLETGSDEF